MIEYLLNIFYEYSMILYIKCQFLLITEKLAFVE